MSNITQTCRITGKQFVVTEADQEFYDKISPVFNGVKYSIPVPTLCPEERQRRRVSWCNERKLYFRKCDISHQEMLAMYAPEVPFTVYHLNQWWSDKWDPFLYGKEFDFHRSFFEQWKELSDRVPRPSLNITFETVENCDYINFAGNSKNSYLIFDSEYAEDCFYGYSYYHCRDSVDCLKLYNSELCYECTDCKDCYDLRFAYNCLNCHSSAFLKNCIGCSNCFASANLRNKQYVFFNEQLTKEQYEQALEKIDLRSYENFIHYQNKAKEHLLKYPNCSMIGRSIENSSGDVLVNCKNAELCFDCSFIEDCKYCYSLSLPSKDCYDCYQYGNGVECCYEDVVVGDNCFQVAFSFLSFSNCSHLYYCHYCSHSSDCFACIGLKHAQYCIFNKQYTKEEYESLVPKIIEHMKRCPVPESSFGTGGTEFGEYFPSSLSPFAYNETIAQEYYPLSEVETQKRKLVWNGKNTSSQYHGVKYHIPDHLNDVDKDLRKVVLECQATGKLYKIIPQEIDLYKKLQVPLPRYCPDYRHQQRLELRNPRKLFSRKCDKCGVDIQTTYAPERPEKIYCEDCYLQSVY